MTCGRFEGSSYDWGKDDVQKLSRKSSQPNAMGEAVKGGYGGGIPVVAFWTGSVGEAIGHVETLPWTLSIPVKVDADGRVNASVDIPANTALKPGESYSAPRSFLAVYSGDFYEPLRMWSSVLQKEGWEIPKPSNEAYNVSWCGWGYEFNVTPAQMLGTVPKLKELGIKWATLDDRWFDTYGDWNPRKDTFPGDSIKQMVDDFHKQGILAQLWWLPLGAEDGQGKWESHKYIVSKVAKEHPDWFILDKNGKHARMTRDLATLVSGGSRGAKLLQATHREIHSRLGIRRLEARQHLQRARMLQPGASPQVAARFRQRDGRCVQDHLPDHALHQAGERDAGLSVRHASVAGVAALHRSGGDCRSRGRRASAPPHQDV